MKEKQHSPRELLEQLEKLRPEDLRRAGFDADKVRRIRQAIRDGTFRTDPEKIADGLIGAAKKLLDKDGK